MTVAVAAKALRSRGLTKAGERAWVRSRNRRARPWQKKWSLQMKRHFTAQEKEVVAKFRAFAPPKQAVVPEAVIDDLLLNHAVWDVILADTGRRIGEAIVMEAGNGALQDLGIVGVSFELDTGGARAFLDERFGDPEYKLIGTWPKDINTTTNTVLRNQLRDELRSQLGEALTSTEGIDRVEGRIAEVFGQARSYRTRRIAQTEVLGCYSHGSEAAFAALEPPGKKWVHSRSGAIKPRDYHVEMDGVIVPFDEPFMVRSPKGGLVAMKHPHDYAAGAEQTINCHCKHTPVMDAKRVAEAVAARAA